jgi:hypothetical protein
VTNQTPNRLHVLPSDFHAKYSNDPYYPPRRTAGTPYGQPDAISESSVMEPYGELTGVLYVEVPRNESDIKLVYRPPVYYTY